MHSRWIVPLAALLALPAVALAQNPPRRPLSPDGAAQTQVLGRWVKGEQPAWTMGREVY